jgi:FkbM family methyltransferase
MAKEQLAPTSVDAEGSSEPQTGQDNGSDFIRARGLKFPDDPSILPQRVRRNLKMRQYEAREADAVRNLVGPEDVVIELGGGIGFMSTLMARSCKAKAVHCFEANPTLIPYIERVYAANDITTATVTNALLGPRKGKAIFYERENFLGSSLDPNAKGASPVVREHEIEVLNIKTVMNKIRPTALVCDIEGAEADLLPLADLSGLRVAVVELHPQWIGQTGVQAVFDAFHSAGLTYYPKTSDKKVVTFLKGW